MATQCQAAAQQLSDPTLRSQIEQLVSSNQALFNRFYNLV